MAILIIVLIIIFVVVAIKSNDSSSLDNTATENTNQINQSFVNDATKFKNSSSSDDTRRENPNISNVKKTDQSFVDNATQLVNSLITLCTQHGLDGSCVLRGENTSNGIIIYPLFHIMAIYNDAGENILDCEKLGFGNSVLSDEAKEKYIENFISEYFGYKDFDSIHYILRKYDNYKCFENGLGIGEPIFVETNLKWSDYLNLLKDNFESFPPNIKSYLKMVIDPPDFKLLAVSKRRT